MMAEIVVGLFVMGALGAVSYAIRRHRERAKWAGIRKEQVEKLKRLRRFKKMIATDEASHNLGE